MWGPGVVASHAAARYGAAALLARGTHAALAAHMPGGVLQPGEANDGEQSFWVPVLMSCLAGLSTTIGGAVVLALDGEPSPEAMAASLALAGAVMLTVSCEMLIPVFFLEFSRLAEAMVCFLVGVALFVLLEKFLAHDHAEDLPLVGPEGSKSQEDNWRLGLLMMATLSAHNLPEGIAVAVSAMDSHSFGVVVAVAIALHNIPEGIVISVPIYAATKSKKTAITYALVSGLAEPLGALLAVLVLRPWVTDRVLENMLAGVAGVMVSVSVIELYPHAWRYSRPLYVLLGTMLGCTVMVLTGMLV